MGKTYLSKLNGLGRRTLIHIAEPGVHQPVTSMLSGLGRRVYLNIGGSRANSGAMIRSIASTSRLVPLKRAPSKAPKNSAPSVSAPSTSREKQNKILNAVFG